MVLRSVEGFSEPPSIETVAEKLGVSPNAIDQAYGVILIDPSRGMYCVQVREPQPPNKSDTSSPYNGPWASPKIDTFG
jgi:hypothetical protein